MFSIYSAAGQAEPYSGEGWRHSAGAPQRPQPQPPQQLRLGPTDPIKGRIVTK